MNFTLHKNMNENTDPKIYDIFLSIFNLNVARHKLRMEIKIMKQQQNTKLNKRTGFLRPILQQFVAFEKLLIELWKNTLCKKNVNKIKL